MSDERLQELGLPRREFLKRAAIGAFAAPVIVSFGLTGTAEAAPTCYPNQTFSNQTHSIFDELVVATFAIWTAEQGSAVDPRFAKQLRIKYLDTAEAVLEDNPRRFCENLGQLNQQITHESGRRIDASFASDLLTEIVALQSAYCQCAI